MMFQGSVEICVKHAHLQEVGLTQIPADHVHGMTLVGKWYLPLAHVWSAPNLGSLKLMLVSNQIT